MKPVLVFRHAPHETLGILADEFDRAGLATRDVELFADLPQSFRADRLSGLVVMGGPMNVDQTDLYPFLRPEIGWIRAAVDAELPVLGICLGSQLLAKALGARVYANRTKEIGWYAIDLTEAAADDALLAGCRRTETVFQWHGDTFDLPPGSVQLAGAAACPRQAFRHGRRAWGLQFHLEVTAEMVADWLIEADNAEELAGLPYIDPAEIRRRTPEELPAMHELGRRVFDRFAALCREGS
ncbi:MAG: type 1 glutamine amidotransferase [Pirellulales bacterium]